MKFRYKEYLFLIVETKEAFFLNITNQLYTGFVNHRVLEMVTDDDTDDVVEFYGTKKRLTYTASKKAFDECVKIKHKFTINPN